MEYTESEVWRTLDKQKIWHWKGITWKCETLKIWQKENVRHRKYVTKQLLHTEIVISIEICTISQLIIIYWYISWYSEDYIFPTIYYFHFKDLKIQLSGKWNTSIHHHIWYFHINIWEQHATRNYNLTKTVNI